MNWQKQWIDDVLAQIPRGRYRKRLEAELRDHLETQCRALAEAGRTEAAAQAEALRVMGEPEKLRKEYHAAWARNPLYRMSWMIVSICVIWALILSSLSLAARLIFPKVLLSNGLVSGAALFLVPFSLGALFLRVCFREERRRSWWVTLGLLLSWVSFNWVFIALMIGFEEIDQYYERSVWMSILLARMPWLTAYLCASFIGCPVLGWLFGRKKKGSLA